jgi:pilus assembly protein Flp/PilA
MTAQFRDQSPIDVTYCVGLWYRKECGAQSMLQKGTMMIYAPAEDGQGLVEYAVILMLIAIVLIVIVAIFGSQVSTMFSQVTSAIPEV